MGKKIPVPEKETLEALLASGKSCIELALDLNVANTTFLRWLRIHEIQLPRDKTAAKVASEDIQWHGEYAIWYRRKLIKLNKSYLARSIL